MTMIGAPSALVEGVEVTGVPYALYDLSASGALVYQEERSLRSSMELVWVTRSGVASPVGPEWTFDFRDPPIPGFRLSPDESRVAVAGRDGGNTDIWIMDLATGGGTRLTDTPDNEFLPRWRPGRDVVTFGTTGPGNRSLWQAAVDGSGSPEPLLEFDQGVVLGEWSPSGEWLALRATGAVGSYGSRDIFVLRPDDESAPTPLVATEEYAEQAPAISPDGRWLAYTSDENGVTEVYVRGFPDSGGSTVRVSTGGGIRPVWAHSDRELFFVRFTGEFVAVEVDTSSGFEIGDVSVLFTLPTDWLIQANADFYDVTSDDQRFLMARPASNGRDPRLVLVQGWRSELERMVPSR